MTGASGERGRNRRSRKKGRPGKRRRREELPLRQAQRSGPDRRRVLLKAVAHPLRRRMLYLMLGEDVPLSAAQLAEKFEVPLGIASYHASVLHRCGAVTAFSPEDG